MCAKVPRMLCVHIIPRPMPTVCLHRPLPYLVNAAADATIYGVRRALALFETTAAVATVDVTACGVRSVRALFEPAS